jgi:hypothetical protein
VLVVTIEKPVHLMAVGHDVGGVDIQGNPLGRGIVAFGEQVHIEILKPVRLGGDLVVAAIVLLKAPLHPPQSGTPGQGFGRFVSLRVRFAQELQERIMAQAVVIGDVLVAQGDTHDPLGQQIGELVDDLILLATILETGRHAREQIQPLRGSAQQHSTRVGCDVSAIEGGEDLSFSVITKPHFRKNTL